MITEIETCKTCCQLRNEMETRSLFPILKKCHFDNKTLNSRKHHVLISKCKGLKKPNSERLIARLGLTVVYNVALYWFVIGLRLVVICAGKLNAEGTNQRQCRNFWRVTSSATNVSATSFPGCLSFDSLDVRRESPGTRLMFQVILDFLRRKNLKRLLSSVQQKFLTEIDSSTH